MTYKQAASLAFRVLGIYLLATNLTFIFYSAQIFFDGGEGISLAMKIFQIVAYCLILLAALLVWRFADFFATLVTSDKDDGQSTKPPEADDLKRVAMVVIGLYMVALSLPALLSTTVRYSVTRILGNVSAGSPFESFYNDISLSQVFDNIFRLIIGLCFILGSRGILRAGGMLRNAGFKEEDTD